MSHACPIIRSKNLRLPDVGGDAALYWDSKFAATLGESMLRLEQDEKLCIRLSKNGLDRSRLFSWEKTARRLARKTDEPQFRKQLRAGT
jgi:hypothetical protein